MLRLRIEYPCGYKLFYYTPFLRSLISEFRYTDEEEGCPLHGKKCKVRQ